MVPPLPARDATRFGDSAGRLCKAGPSIAAQMVVEVHLLLSVSHWFAAGVDSPARVPHCAAGRTSRGPFRMKTYVATPANREREWLVVDATGKTLGRLATQLADTLRGKRKPEYTPHCDVGDFVIVVNAEKISVTGKKREEKRYYRHSGYPGGLRSRTFNEMLDRRPEEIIRLAVKGMLPRNRLARAQLRKLKVYAGPDHPHEAQQPKQMEINA